MEPDAWLQDYSNTCKGGRIIRSNDRRNAESTNSLGSKGKLGKQENAKSAKAQDVVPIISKLSKTRNALIRPISAEIWRRRVRMCDSARKQKSRRPRCIVAPGVPDRAELGFSLFFVGLFSGEVF